MKFISLLAQLILISFVLRAKVPSVVYDKNAKGLTLLAVKELHRYLYLRTGQLSNVKAISSENNLPFKSIFIVTKRSLLSYSNFKSIIYNVKLGEESFQLISVSDSSLLIIGGSELGCLYGTYKFLESTGIGFSLDEDLIPDRKISKIRLSGFNVTYNPVFALRGLLPFHDFPEGPDWWNEEEYKTVITQMPKLGMNFIGFHTYPEVKFSGYYKAEPLVWMGNMNQFDSSSGNVMYASPVMHFNTNDSTFDYYPKKTTEFNFGASQLFETEDYGADYMKNKSKWPHTLKENIDIINNVGLLLKEVFSKASILGIKTCVGTEVPLVIPANLLKDSIIMYSSHIDSFKQDLYKALFSRVKAMYPIDYYWFWTPEMWTWIGERAGEVDKIEKDIFNAFYAAQEVNIPFKLAMCGWVLGPSRNRKEFDKLFPKEMPFGVINRQQGFAPVEPAFSEIKGRPKWQISWLEDDPALISPQFWAGRIRKDAQDAFEYGCTGLMGIHWRTRSISPALLSLAKAGWEADTYIDVIPKDQRDYPVRDLYYQWATFQFGSNAAEKISKIFQKLDGGLKINEGQTDYTANFPRASNWGDMGPGRIVANKISWEEIKEQYNFIKDYETCKHLVQGVSNIEHYNYWLNNFYYAFSLAKTGCLMGKMESIADSIKKETNSSIRAALAINLLLYRDSTSIQWGEMVTYLLAAVNTTGEMGTIANLEQHNIEKLNCLGKYDSLISSELKTKLKPIVLPKEYKGESRIIVTAKRTLLFDNECFKLRIRILTSEKIRSVVFCYKNLGTTFYKKRKFEWEGANVFKLSFQPQEQKDKSFEYFVRVNLGNGKHLLYPMLENKTQTVVVFSKN